LTIFVSPRRFAGAALLHRTCAIGWLIFGLAVLGGVIVTGNPVWWRYSICALGRNASPAPWVFNDGVLVAACVFAVLAAQTRTVLRPCVRGTRLTARHADGVAGAVMLVAAALVVLALVPYDAGPLEKLVHNTAGWGSGWVVAGSMVLVSRRLPIFSRRFYVQTWFALGVFVSCFLGFETGLMTYAQAEIGAICTAALWSTVLFANLERIRRESATVDRSRLQRPGLPSHTG
jgi:hypothetical protein